VALTRRQRWLLKQPLWWFVVAQSAAEFLLAAGVGGDNSIVHRVALGICAMVNNVVTTLALFADAPRVPFEEMSDRERAELLTKHPEAAQRLLGHNGGDGHG
jgi:hypothetical protein